MVDVGEKPTTTREATAAGRVFMSPATVRALRAGKGPKGNVVEVARLAGIMGAKRTADLVPLCHPLPLVHVDVQLAARRDGFEIVATARAHAQTGVEMEALTAVSVAALTLYDMAKAVDRAMSIGEIRLLLKTGGASGTWRRPAATAGTRRRRA